MSYKVTVSNNNISVNTTSTTNTVKVEPVNLSVSLSRTGGQGSKGDSISSIYMSDGILYATISNSAGDVISTETIGDVAAIVGTEISIGELNNVTITSANESDILKYDAATQTWVNEAFAHTHPMAEISDVNLTGLQNGDILAYNTATLNWTPYNLYNTFYSESEVDALLSAKADSVHNHDSRYYTETEVDAFLATKSNTNHTHTLSELTDTDISNPQGDQVLRWNGLDWVNSDLALSDIGEFVIDPSVVSGEILKWNGANWVNNTLAEAGIAAASHTHTLDDLSNVADTATTEGELVVYDGTGHTWVTRKATTSDIQDIDNTGKADGAVLVYNGTTSKYEATTVVQGGTF